MKWGQLTVGQGIMVLVAAVVGGLLLFSAVSTLAEGRGGKKTPDGGNPENGTPKIVEDTANDPATGQQARVARYGR